MDEDVCVENQNANDRRRTAKDYEAIISEINKPVKNPAPRGKHIIHPDQARYLYCDISQESSCLSPNSTLSRSPILRSKEMDVDVCVENQNAIDRRRTAKDYEAIISEIRKPVKNPAPRGKHIIHPDQARYLYCDISQESSCQSADSTPSRSSILRSKADISCYGTRVKEDRRLTDAERRVRNREMLRERQLQYHEQEMALGGYHDVFNDPCPDFTSQKFANDPSDSIVTSDEECKEEKQSDTSSGPSQGRLGQGCSTPKNMANHTFAALRTIDVSVVNMQDTSSNDVCFEAGTKRVAEKTSAIGSQIPSTQMRTKIVNDSVRLNLPNADNDSMENVLSRMRATPKKVNPVIKRGLFTTLRNKPDQDEDVSALPNSSPVEIRKTSFASHQCTDASQDHDAYTEESPQNRTYVIEKNSSVEENADIPNAERVVCTSSDSNTISSSDVVFAVPALPRKILKNPMKTTVQQREERANVSQKNTSILETMNLDLQSPGRTLFAGLPPKKKCSLAATPVKAASVRNEDAMEISIAMSDISQQPSDASGDDSVVDPVTDPRPSQATPCRTRPAVTPLKGNETFVRHSCDNLDSSKRLEIIQKSVERLSQPRVVGNRRVHERCMPDHGISPHRGAVNNSSAAEPVTPFQPFDPSRMFTSYVDRSGTARRIAPPKRVNTLLSSSLFAKDLKEGSKNIAIKSNRLKRQGECKPKSGGDVFDSTKTAYSFESNQTAASPITSVKNKCNYTAPTVANDSTISHMGANCSTQPSAQEIVKDSNESVIVEAAQRLSLKDSSPTEANYDAQGDFELNDQTANSQNEGLLTGSVLSRSTPGRESPEAVKVTLSSSELETNSRISTESTAFECNPNVSAELISSKPCTRKRRNDVLVLKPREVVAPSTPFTPNVRRSTRNRMKPVRQWLGEKAVYTASPRGGRTLVGVTKVEVREKRWIKVRTMNYKLAQEREQQLAAHRRILREKRRQEARRRKMLRLRDLSARHERGIDLDITLDSVVTSSDDEDSDKF